jgi:anthranilate synthase component 1
VAVLTIPGTPDLLALHASNPGRYPYLLQTLGAQGWDILFAFPRQISLFTLPELQSGKSPFFSELANAWQIEGGGTASTESTDLPFRGGWFVYLGYELLQEIEHSVSERGADLDGFPAACLTRIPAAIMVNRHEGQTNFFAENADDGCLAAMQDDLENCPAFLPSSFLVETISEEKEDIFLHGVERIKQYIHAGDVFQVNLSRSWQIRLTEQDDCSASLFASLRSSNPAPFSGLANFADHQIISSSPERLVKVSGRQIEARPIAGTHPRSQFADEDEKLRRDLLAHPKERAEHIMLVDLERNDLGRICQPGSIKVEEMMGVHTYAYVHHIESSISGRLRDGVTPAQILHALFPGGTITGCPKVRTMQIIRELEQTPRLAYTGSMGYLNLDGDMDLNILIRSFMLSGKALNLRAGAGIVADSDPERELNETHAKAKGLLKALGIQG